MQSEGSSEPLLASAHMTAGLAFTSDTHVVCTRQVRRLYPSLIHLESASGVRTVDRKGLLGQGTKEKIMLSQET